MVIALWLLSAAWAGVHVVTSGETLEGVLDRLGAGDRADEVRRMNGLGPGEQPAPGTVLDLPGDLSSGTCQPSYLRTFAGDGTIQRPGSAVAEPLGRRAPLPVGTLVCTGLDSFATVSLALDLGGAGYDDVTLMPETCITIRGSFANAGPTARTSVLALQQGSLSVREAGQGKVVVETAAGVTLGDQGGFRVSREPEATRTEAVGAEVLTIAQGAQVRLPEGYGGRTVIGQAPGPAIALPGVGRLLYPLDGSLLLRPDFAWTAAENVLGYYVEISVVPDFTEIVWKQRVGMELWEPRSLVLPATSSGVYWRVTSFDRAGFEGPPSEAWWLTLPVVQ